MFWIVLNAWLSYVLDCIVECMARVSGLINTCSMGTLMAPLHILGAVGYKLGQDPTRVVLRGNESIQICNIGVTQLNSDPHIK